MNSKDDYDAKFESRARALPADDGARPEHQNALREQALAVFERALETHTRPSRVKRIFFLGRDFMKRPMPRYLVAASLLAALVWMLMPGVNSSARAVTQIIDAVMSARSARFQAEVHDEIQPKQTFKMLYLAPAKYRMEAGTQVYISDFEAAKMLTLVRDTKQAIVMNLKNAPKDKATQNYFENLRRLLGAQRDNLPAYQRLGEKMIEGHKAVGFKLESAMGTVTLWGDPQTGQPIRIESLFTGVPKTEVVMTQFEMNIDLPADLFAMNIPKDYQVQSFDVDASKPEERDLVESLRVCAKMSGDAFPDALDTASITRLIIDTVLKSKDDGQEKEKITQQLMNESIKIGRGFQFALSLPAAAKAHYAGKGVKKDTPDRPIFWYLPEGARRFRVIDAALAVHDADEAPRVEGAVPLGKIAPASGS
jgi:outer membrane lipoprotein-sorting protein